MMDCPFVPGVRCPNYPDVVCAWCDYGSGFFDDDGADDGYYPWDETDGDDR